MLIVYEVVVSYCKDNKLPPPSKLDLENIGRLISYHFKNFYCSKIPVDTVIDQTGLCKVNQEGRAVIVAFYPDAFKSEMVDRIQFFYECKAKRIEGSKKDNKPKRKRIKVGAVKVGSSSKNNTNAKES